MENRFVKRFWELRSMGIKPEFQMVLCGLDLQGKASIYTFDDRGLAEPVQDNPGYAVIGSGFVTGSILLMRLLGYKPEMPELGRLTTFILDNVSEVDTSVGAFVGESYLLSVQVRDGKRILYMGLLTGEALKEFKDVSKKRKELIGKLWQVCDSVGEQAVEKSLDQLQAESNEQKEK